MYMKNNIKNKSKIFIPELWELICSYDYTIPTYEELNNFNIGDIKWLLRTKKISLGFVDYNYNCKKNDIYEKSNILGELNLIAKNKEIHLILNYNNINIITGKKIKEKGIHICFFNYDKSGFDEKKFSYNSKYNDNILFIKKWVTEDIKIFQYVNDGVDLNPHDILNIDYNFNTNNGIIYCNCIYNHSVALSQLMNIKPY